MSRLFLLLALAACPPPDQPVESAADAAIPGIVYPPAATVDVVDEYHGTAVSDPYRWLEDPDTPESRAWIDAQNRLTESWLAHVPERKEIRDRLEALWNYERYSAPSKKAGKIFFYRNDGLQNQSVLHVADGLDAEPRVLLDPNTLSEDGTVALSGASLSEDGKHLAWAVSDGGSDWSVWRVRDVATGEDLPDTIEWTKFTRATWTHDGKGFYYSRYPAPETPLQQVNLNNKLYYHALGTPQSEDVLVYERPDQPEWGFGSEITDDGRWLLIHVWQGTEPKNRVYMKDLSDPKSEVAKVFDAYDAYYHLVGNEGDTFWFQTDKDAPRGKVVAVDRKNPAPEAWKTVIPQSDDALEGVSLVGGHFVAQYLHDARSAVKVFDTSGTLVREVELPGIGSVSGFGGEPDDPETFFTFTGFTSPSTAYRYDVATGEVTPWRVPKVDFDPEAYVTEQVFYESKDGTKIPMFLVHKKGLEKDGQNPTLLYGYGGFGVSMTPGFSVPNLVWMERGGVYAMPNLRGGGEYGREWHEAGTLDRKQNVFDDFVAAAEWLIANGYTSSDKLAIRGGSNGGLLVGATMTQRPDLVAAAIPQVGVLDMLRYHQFTIGWAWASDYGTSDDPAMFPVLRAYSPVHNVKPGTSYPATLITTGDHDDRVVPAHSFKFAAALQAAQSGPDPVLIRIETRAGHGGGKPTARVIDEAADITAFLVETLGMR